MLISLIGHFGKNEGIKYLEGKQFTLIMLSSLVVYSGSFEDNGKPIVIGATYTYNSLVTTQESSSRPVMLPSQYSSSKQHSKSKKEHHHHSRKPKKSFNAFLNDTNDEWNDDIFAATPPVNKPIKEPKRKVSSNPKGIKDHVDEILLGKDQTIKILR